MIQERLSRKYLAEYPGEAARVLEARSPDLIAGILGSEEPAVAARVTGEFLPVFAGSVITAMETTSARQLIENLEADQIGPVLFHTAPERRNEIVEGFPDDWRRRYRRLYTFPRECAGALMNPFALVLRAGLRVKEAQKEIHEFCRKDLYYPFVVDDSQRFLGSLEIRSFMLAAPGRLLSDICVKTVSVRGSAHFEEINRIPNAGSFPCFPVTDESGQFLGVLSQEAFQSMGDRSPHTGPKPLSAGLVEVGEMFLQSQAVLIPLVAGAFANAVRPPQPEGREDGR